MFGIKMCRAVMCSACVLKVVILCVKTVLHYLFSYINVTEINHNYGNSWMIIWCGGIYVFVFHKNISRLACGVVDKAMRMCVYLHVKQRNVIRSLRVNFNTTLIPGVNGQPSPCLLLSESAKMQVSTRCEQGLTLSLLGSNTPGVFGNKQ